MKQKITLFVILLLCGFAGQAQVQFWSDTFETGSPTSGTRTPEENGGTASPSTAYFKLTDGTTVSQVVPFTGKEGTNFWAGEDHNAAGTGFTASGAQGAATNSPNNELQILWSNINISGKTGLSFKGLLAANSTNEPWDNTQACNSGVGTTNTDYIIIEYSIDGGPYTSLIRFFNRGSATGVGDKYLFEDTDGNGCGDGTQLTNAFNEFTKTISGTGTTMNLLIRVFSEGSNEEWGIDNFRLFATPACTAPVVTNQPSNASVCNNGITFFSVAATGATAYQWQVNTGSGFTDITNGGVYSNATTSTLTITGATTTMNGYLYRCVVINGVPTCFTNSNSATLTVSNPALTPLSQTNVACNGGSTGAASVNVATGGVGPYTYNWTPGNPTGDGTTSVTGLTAGTWTCTVTDAAGCTASQNFTITQPTALSLTPSVQTNVACNGGNTGAATVNVATGGAGGYTYNWTPGNPTGDGTTSVTGLTAGTWTCTVTDANGCTTSRNFTITQPAALVATAASQTNVACNGGSNGAASINTPTGGAGGYTYNWTPGNPTGDGTTSVTGLTAGTWTCTVTDANACTTTVNFTITQPTALVATAASQTNVSCNGGSNGAASINTPTGGAGGYTYNWTPGNPTGDGTTSVSGLTAGTWTCTITDANSCTTAVNFTITQPTALVATAASQTNVACNGGSNGAASINTPTGGAGGYTYNWTPGNPTGDGTTSVTGLTAGTWTCTITDANSCTTSVNFTITQPTALVVTAASQTNVACNGGSNGAASINTPTGGAGGYTYNWTPGNPTGDGTTSVSGLTAGTWTCTITDANSCTTSVNFTITQPTALVATAASQTNVACNGGSNGAASINTPTGGAGGYTYNWTPGNPTGDGTTSVSGLTAGTWTCTITDANSCTTTVNFTITQPTALVATAASQTNVSCNGGSNGAASINTPTGGAGGYTYNWTPGNPTGDGTTSVSGLTAGTWTCTITDANACTTTVNFTITQPTALVATAASQTNVACNGGSNGAASINTPTGGAGGYTYDWTPGNPTGDGTTSVTGLTPGTWTCTITDANSCTTTVNFTITQPTALVVTPAAQTNVACNGDNDGAASINTPTGGAGGYTYNWTPGNPTGDGTTSVTNLSAGTWTCTVTDANGCSTSQNFTITEPTPLVVSAGSITNVSCNGGADGAASITTPTGGAGGYTYNWIPGNPTGDGTTSVTGLTAGTWTCIVTDANGCGTLQNFSITEPAAVNSNVTQAAGVLTADQAGATYQWYTCPNTLLTGETNQSYTPTVVGDYKVEVTVAGCTVTSSCVTVTTLGSESFDLFAQFKMYPNPSNGRVNIDTDIDGDVVIVNQLGQTLQTIRMKANVTNTINIDHLSEGTYFVKGINGTNIATQRLILRK